MAHKVVYLKAKVGMQSLIGASSKRPTSWGNYFWLDDGKLRTDYGMQYRVANMWSENLEHARDNFLQTEQNKNVVRCLMWDCGPQRGKFVLIQDDRIPADYYYQKLCFTGGFPPDLDSLREMYAIVGDPNNELEQYTDPEKYHAARGGSYNAKTGVISYTFKEQSTRPLKSEFTIEQAKELKAIHGIDVEEELAKILHDTIKKEIGNKPLNVKCGVEEPDDSWNKPDDQTLRDALNREQELRDAARDGTGANTGGETKAT